MWALYVAGSILVVGYPVIALEAGAGDKERHDPADEGKDSKHAPDKDAALGVGIYREGEQAARDEWSDAPA